MFSNAVEESLGPVKSSIMGKYAKGTPPPGTPQTFEFKGMKLVLPYILKGILLGKAKHSPFFANSEAIVPPEVLSADERQAARAAAGVYSGLRSQQPLDGKYRTSCGVWLACFRRDDKRVYGLEFFSPACTKQKRRAG
jgi:hypothetical protein